MRRGLTRAALGRMALGAALILPFGCAAVLNTLEGALPEDTAAGKGVRGLNRLRKSFEDLDPSEEHYIGRSVAAEIVAMPVYRVSDDAHLTEYVGRVGNGIALSVEAVRHTFNGYRFAVLDTDEVNAFATPGGTIFISKGMIKRTQNEDELAGVLAHEIAHVSLRHGLSAIKKSNLTSAFSYLGASAAQATLKGEDLKKVTDIFGDSIQDVMTTMVKNGYSKESEYEADKNGAAFAAAAGYDPGALAAFIGRLQAEGGKGGLMATHPAPADRLANLGKPPAWTPDPEGLRVRTERHHECVPH